MAAVLGAVGPAKAAVGGPGVFGVGEGEGGVGGRMALSRFTNPDSKDEVIKREIFSSLAKRRNIIEGLCKHYNTKRHHSYLSYRPPTLEGVQWQAKHSEQLCHPRQPKRYDSLCAKEEPNLVIEKINQIISALRARG